MIRLSANPGNACLSPEGVSASEKGAGPGFYNGVSWPYHALLKIN